MPARESRMPASSSTMRILCMLGDGGRWGSFGYYRKFDDKAGSYGTIFFHADRAMVIFHDAAHDRKPQARPPLLGREIRQKELLFEFAGDSVAGIGNRDLDGIAARHKSRGNLDLTNDRVLRGFRGIIHQVRNGTLDRLISASTLGKSEASAFRTA